MLKILCSEMQVIFVKMNQMKLAYLEIKVIYTLCTFIHQVTQRDVPGIDHAYLAMDTEDGVEVVWNEVQFSEKKSSKAQMVREYAFDWSVSKDLFFIVVLLVDTERKNVNIT